MPEEVHGLDGVRFLRRERKRRIEPAHLRLKEDRGARLASHGMKGMMPNRQGFLERMKEMMKW